MTITQVTVGGVKGINYGKPGTLAELKLLTKASDDAKAEAIVLNAANQYYLQQNLIRVRSKATELVSKKFEVKPKLYIGKVEVIATVDNEGKTNGFKSVEGKKVFKADEITRTESDKDFIDRVKAEKSLTDKQVFDLMQKAADQTPFEAEQKRVRGSVTSKPVGKKWLSLAEKIIKAGNGEKAVAKLGISLDLTSEDASKRLALALAEKSRLAREAEEQEAGELAGTEEQALVVDGVKG